MMENNEYQKFVNFVFANNADEMETFSVNTRENQLYADKSPHIVRPINTLDLLYFYMQYKPSGELSKLLCTPAFAKQMAYNIRPLTEQYFAKNVDISEIENVSRHSFANTNLMETKKMHEIEKLYKGAPLDIIMGQAITQNTLVHNVLQHMMNTRFPEFIKSVEKEITANAKKYEYENQIINQTKGETKMGMGIEINGDKNDKRVTELTNLGELMAKRNPILIGREQIIDECIEAMMLYDLPNPVLVGQPGCGKTAIVEYLAHLMYQKKADEAINGKDVYRFDIAQHMSGMGHVGDVERKFSNLMDFIKDKDAWVYVDETHNLIGAGASSKSDLDIPQLLKPHLQDGTIKLIGSTTPAEYETIKHDGAFMRRLERINVPVLTREQVYDVLVGIRAPREKKHNVVIPTGLCQSIVDECENVIGNSPAKEIRVLDHACVKAQREKVGEVGLKHVGGAISKQVCMKAMGFVPVKHDVAVIKE
jgi:ATP-dependent Clp protease ATP-binding subunit ClpA